MSPVRMVGLALLLCAPLLAGCMFDGPRDLKYASVALRVRDYDQAARFASRALWLGGLDQAGKTRAYKLRAQAALALSRPQEALSDLDRALGINPRDSQALLSRGTIYLARGRARQALADLERGLALAAGPQGRYSRGSTPFWARLASARLQTGDLDQAWAACQKAWSLDHNHPLAHAVASQVLEKRGDLAQALEYMEKAWALQSRKGFYVIKPGGDPWLRRLVRLRMVNKRDYLGRDRAQPVPAKKPDKASPMPGGKLDDLEKPLLGK